MKKTIMLFSLLLLLIVSACGTDNETETNNTNDNEETNQAENQQEEDKQDKEKQETTQNDDSQNDGTFTYESENGPIDVPVDPQRVVSLYYAGNVLAHDVNIVGVDSWSKMSPHFEDDLKDAQVVSEEDLEKIIELEPDLIIGLSSMKNIDKLQEIAPTVTYTYGKLDYLEQQIEIGKLLNKEEEAREWVEDFQQRAQEAGEQIKDKIGEDATVTVIENFEKQLYVYGDNWARGTEILYQEMELKMPEKVKEKALEPGYFAFSPEVLPEFAGDYIVFSKDPNTDASFQETETYKNIPAVKNDRVFEANASKFYFNDPLTLEYQLQFFIDHFLGE